MSVDLVAKALGREGKWTAEEKRGLSSRGGRCIVLYEIKGS